jgi:hypothetical protein
LFVPETMTLMTVLAQFKRTHLPVALVVDEFGDVGGLVSLTDVIGSIVGDLPVEPGEEPAIVRREDGSVLFDGALDLDTVLRALNAKLLLSDEDRQHYHTLGWLAMLALGRVPEPATCSSEAIIDSRSSTWMETASTVSSSVAYLQNQADRQGQNDDQYHRRSAPLPLPRRADRATPRLRVGQSPGNRRAGVSGSLSV